MITDIDVREALPQIRVPTLLMHRTGDRAVDAEASRYAAGRIPGARMVELPDGDNLPFVGDTEAVAAEIEEFLTVSRTRQCRIGCWPRSCSPTSPARPNAIWWSGVLARSSGILFGSPWWLMDGVEADHLPGLDLCNLVFSRLLPIFCSSRSPQ